MSGSQGNQKGSKRFELEEIDDQDTMSDNERYNERGTTEGLPALLAGLANRTPDELAALEGLVGMGSPEATREPEALPRFVPPYARQPGEASALRWPSEQPSQPTQPDTTQPPPPRPVRINQFDVARAIAGELAEFIRYGMRAGTFSFARRQQIAAVYNAIGNEATIREAMIYLEDTDWDIGAAIQQWRFDLGNRSRLDAMTNYGTRPRAPRADRPRGRRDENRGINRRRIRGGTNHEPTDLKIRITRKKDWKEYDYEKISPSFDANNPVDLLRANKWKNEILRQVPRVPLHAGRWWHPIEKRYLRNLFGKADPKLKKFPDYNRLMRKFNGAFEGHFMPGEEEMATKRDYGSITSAVDRMMKAEFRNKPMSDIAKLRKAHALAGDKRKADRVSFEILFDENDEAKFCATEEDVDMVEFEESIEQVEKYETSTDEWEGDETHSEGDEDS